MASTSAPAEQTTNALDLLLDCILAARLQGASVLATVAARGHLQLLRALIQKYQICSTVAVAAAATAGAGPWGGSTAVGAEPAADAALAPAGTAPAAEAAPTADAAPARGSAGGQQEPGATAEGPSIATVGLCASAAADLGADHAAAVLAVAEHGHASCLRALLDAAPTGPAAIGDLLAARSPDRRLTPLMLAAIGRHAGCIDVLLRHSPEAQVAAASTVPVQLHYLDPLPAGCTALMFAGAVADRDCMERLLAHAPAAQVAAVDTNGTNALCWAASGTEDCRADLLRLLLAHEPDAQVVVSSTQTGYNALMYAACRGNAACMEALLEHLPEVQVAAADASGETALMHAVRCEPPACAELSQLLLRHSPDVQVTARNANQRNSLMFATAYDADPACVRLLLRHSPESQVTAVDEDGANALMHAGGAGAGAPSQHMLCSAAVMRLLLEHAPEAQLAAVQPNGNDALLCCADVGNAAGVELLLPLRPSADSLHAALLQAACTLHDLPNNAAWSGGEPRPSVESLHKVMELLLSAGAMLAPDDDPIYFAEVQPVIQDMARRALVPDRVNEAVVGLALAGSSSRKRPRDQEPGAA